MDFSSPSGLGLGAFHFDLNTLDSSHTPLSTDGSLPPNADAMCDIFFQGIANNILAVVNPPEQVSLSPALPGQNIVQHNSDDYIGIDTVALHFARTHRTALASFFDGFHLDGWVRLCDRLLLKYISRIGVENLRAFKRRDREDIVAWLTLEYEDMLREGYSFEDQEVQLSTTVKGVVTTEVGRSLINNRTFLKSLVRMITEDMQRVVYAAWLTAAKRIANIICQNSTGDPSPQMQAFLSRGTYHGVHTYNFFHDLDASSDAPGKLFTGQQARNAIALALRTATPLVDEDTPLFGIFDFVHGEDYILHYRLLQSSPSHTTNVVSSLVLLVLSAQLDDRNIPTLSERKLTELKVIFDGNKETFRQVMACSQNGVPMAMQEMFRLNLLNILSLSCTALVIIPPRLPLAHFASLPFSSPRTHTFIFTFILTLAPRDVELWENERWVRDTAEIKQRKSVVVSFMRGGDEEGARQEEVPPSSMGTPRRTCEPTNSVGWTKGRDGWSGVDGEQRRQKLRADQRFMKMLHDQTATLTGASGAALHQIKIPPVGAPSSQPPSKPQKQKAQKQFTESITWLTERMRGLDSETSLSSLEKSLSDLKRNLRSNQPFVAVEFALYRLHRLFQHWILDPGRESVAVHDKHAVTALRTIKDILEIDYSTSDIRKCVQDVLNVLGFSAYMDVLISTSTTPEDRPLTFKFVKLVKSKTHEPLHAFMRVKEHPVQWQLRVFEKVLDAIDDNKSLLVVAPTSAVLRGSDEGVIVYVAPTKALVAQVTAEIYAWFSKDLHGRSCWAIYMHDYRIHDPSNCQILVTVPEILAIMMLSPALAKVWTPRVTYIILDEIHTIGQQEGGSVWEQIRLLAPCPIIGLSVMVGAPEKFNAWLEAVQKASGFQHTFVHHPHRYSHLRKFFYNIHEKPSSTFESISAYESTGWMRFLHPIAMLAFGPRSIPSDLTLEASDTLALYRALAAYGDTLATKHVIAYNTALKACLAPMVAEFDRRKGLALLYKVIAGLEDSGLARVPTKVINAQRGREAFRENLIHLVCDLHAQGDLIMADTLLCVLLTKEEKWRASNLEWQRKLAQYEEWLSRAKDREWAAARAAKNRADLDEVMTKTVEWEATFDPNALLSQFSFAGTLALGINAPTKTSVFCGDSPYLTALMYRQCAGRAGRRGYDLLGKVVFYGLPMDRVQRLTLSNLPSLGANFPVTSTLVLRIFNLLEGSGYAPAAVNAVQRFINYLRHARLLDEHGRPFNLFGIASHHTEAKRDFILLMSHLFGGRYLPGLYLKKNVIKRSASMVILPPLSDDSRRVLTAHEEEILRIFTRYALTYGSKRSAELGPDTRLPLSGTELGGTPTSDTAGWFGTWLQETALRVVVRSLFVVNSGHADRFESVADLARMARRGLSLNEHAIPSFAPILATPGGAGGLAETKRKRCSGCLHSKLYANGFALNAYILDFYTHGQVQPLTEADAIRRADVWLMLQQFDLTVMTMGGVLDQLIMQKQGCVDLREGSDTGEDEGEGGSLDSGFIDVDDPTEKDEDMDGEDEGGKQSVRVESGVGHVKHSWVVKRDWRVLEVVSEAMREFDKKFKAMWVRGTGHGYLNLVFNSAEQPSKILGMYLSYILCKQHL
ncbi:hypothetical protein HD554DRAFT_2317482 [Boletus coccyginus]|nr:hypothetical protein HD554DRAFT_2317482 [Boletus coccyginus]